MQRLENPKPKTSEKLYGKLVEHYSEPHRAYHTLEHIVSMLNELNNVPPELCRNKMAIEIAIWWHDDMYDVGDSDNPHVNWNENFSAKMGKIACIRLGQPAEGWQDNVRDMILCTDHKSPPLSGDEKIIVDLDLVILGKPQEEFLRYEHAIRKEYAWVSYTHYQEARTEILKGFLNKRHIYHTEFFRKKYEENARKNLSESIKKLSA